MYENIGTRLPKDLVKDIEYLSKEEQSDKSKIVRELLALAVKEKLIDLALKKYMERKISIGKAAALAKLSVADFMKIAAERKIPVNYSIASLEEDFRRATHQK